VTNLVLLWTAKGLWSWDTPMATEPCILLCRTVKAPRSWDTLEATEPYSQSWDTLDASEPCIPLAAETCNTLSHLIAEKPLVFRLILRFLTPHDSVKHPKCMPHQVPARRYQRGSTRLYLCLGQVRNGVTRESIHQEVFWKWEKYGHVRRQDKTPRTLCGRSGHRNLESRKLNGEQEKATVAMLPAAGRQRYDSDGKCSTYRHTIHQHRLLPPSRPHGSECQRL